MDSSTYRAQAERQKQLELRQQIKRLQSQLTDIPDDDPRLHSPKRKRTDGTLLAPATPSPKKKRRIERDAVGQGRKRPDVRSSATSEGPRRSDGAGSAGIGVPTLHHAKPAPSNVLNRLAALRPEPTTRSEPATVVRSSGLAEKPRPKPPEASARAHTVEDTGYEARVASTSSTGLPQRDDNLAIVEDLQMGPTSHKPPLDDPRFERLEPNSSIRLSSRSISHEDLQEYLRGRYYLSPSRLYSCIRLLPNKSGYDVPVDGDWVTIAVVAERGLVKHTRAPVDITPGDDGRASNDESGTSMSHNPSTRKKHGKNAPPDAAKPQGKKYVSMKLIDFGARSRSSASGGKATLRGDAFLTLLLFESDNFDKVTEENGNVKKIYQGGSKGAFEAMSKLKEGDVVALLNPKVLKPLQRNDKTPHPVDNILAVTPESASSIAIIGRALDLGMCKVIKRDGKPCGSWTDKRVSEVCEWHITHAVQRQRAGRPEFSAGTSGMTTTSARKRKPEYDPSRQWGLQPEPSTSSSSVYNVSGHIVGGAAGDMFTSEKMGREAQTKAKRRLEQDADKELKMLLDRDKEGMRAVTKAREVAAKMLKVSEGKKVDKSKGKGKAKKVEGDEEDEQGASVNAAAPVAPAYSATIIKHLGFDPAAKAGQKRVEDLSIQKKLEALAAVQGSRKNITLGPRPGPKIRSGVSVPAFMLQEESTSNVDTHDSDELEVIAGEDDGLIDLDDSDD